MGAWRWPELDERAYDLILCDMRMPELYGPTLYRLLERQRPLLCSRLIFLTGDTLEPATQDFLEQSGAPCLTKPFPIAEARHIIWRTLEGVELDPSTTRDGDPFGGLPQGAPSGTVSNRLLSTPIEGAQVGRILDQTMTSLPPP